MTTTQVPTPTPGSIRRRTEHAKIEKALTSLNKLTGLAFDATAELRATMTTQMEALAETPEEERVRLTYEKRISNVGLARAKRAAEKKQAKTRGRVRRLVMHASCRRLHQLHPDEVAMWERIDEHLLGLPAQGRWHDGPTLDDAAALNHVVNPKKMMYPTAHARAKMFLDLPHSLQLELFEALTVHPKLWPHRESVA